MTRRLGAVLIVLCAVLVPAHAPSGTDDGNGLTQTCEVTEDGATSHLRTYRQRCGTEAQCVHVPETARVWHCR